jgi:polyisoprenoid-binding protein YceI
MTSPVSRFIAAALLFAACGGGAVATATPNPSSTSPAPTATVAAATASATPAATAAPSTAPSAKTWTVGAASKAVVRVREQLVGVSLPNDAVLTATGGTGTFTLNADGTFSPDSKITFDLTTLSSDSRDRDNFIKMDTLNTRQFPTATLVPTKATGLTLPASGEFTFKLTGNLTIRGKTKEVTFDVVATRTGTDLRARATLNPSVKFGDFGMTPPTSSFRVVSIVDEIRLVVELAATGAAA